MHIEPDQRQFADFTAQADTTTPVTMLNLLRYRAEANYDNDAAAPCSGREAYRRYADGALACVAAHGGRMVYGGAGLMTVIGPAEEYWDDVLLVEYPSIQAMLDMLASPDYRAIAFHRTAALADSRLVATNGARLNFSD